MKITSEHASVLRKVEAGHVGWDPSPKTRGFTRRMSSGMHRRYEPTSAQLRELIVLWQLKFSGFIGPVKADVPGPVALTDLGDAELNGSAKTTQDRRSA